MANKDADAATQCEKAITLIRGNAKETSEETGYISREEIGEVPERRSERLNKYIGISSSLRVAIVFPLADYDIKECVFCSTMCEEYCIIIAC